MKLSTTTALILSLAVALAACGDKNDDKQAPKPGQTKAGAKSGDKGAKTPPKPKRIKMVAKLAAKNGSSVHGNVWLSQGTNTSVIIQIEGLTPGLHGLQITETGDCSSEDGLSAGEPYNPTNSVHGKPDGPRHQTGDIGNVAANATGKAEKVTGSTEIHLKGEHSVAGRGLVVYAGQHDLRTHPRGNAGDIVACGVIELEKPAGQQ